MVVGQKPCLFQMSAEKFSEVNVLPRIVKFLKKLKQTNRHPMYKGVKHPINFNLGKISGGVWQSSVPANCTVSARVGFFPSMHIFFLIY